MYLLPLASKQPQCAVSLAHFLRPACCQRAWRPAYILAASVYTSLACSVLLLPQVLEVTNIASMWPQFFEDHGWFVDATRHNRFVNRMRFMTSVMCCLADQPGWIWYDLMWDVPHKDRFNRVFQSWHIKRGDAEQKGRRALMAAMR